MSYRRFIGSPPPTLTVTAPEYGFQSVTRQTNENTGLTYQWERRTGINWEETETTVGSGIYDWTVLDDYVTLAQSIGNNLILVIKVGHPLGYVDTACRAAVTGNDGTVAIDPTLGSEVGILGSCPLTSPARRNFQRWIMALITRYGNPGRVYGAKMDGLSSDFQLILEVENEAANPTYWARDARGDGVSAADDYEDLLRTVWHAREWCQSAAEVVACGFIHVDRAGRFDVDSALSEQGIITQPFNRRILEFQRRVIGMHKYYDALDVHVFTYPRFMPDDWDKGFAWLRHEMALAGNTKKIYTLEWTPAFLGFNGNRNLWAPFTRYFPYTSDIASNPFMGEYQYYQRSGSGPADVTFSAANYNGAGVDACAVAVTDENCAVEPNTFYWTSDYQFDGIDGTDTVWNGPQAMTGPDAPFSMTNNVRVYWASTTGHTPSFAVGAGAYPTGFSSDPVYLKDKAKEIYLNLYLDEGNNATYRAWLDKENAVEGVKVLANLVTLGSEKFSHAQFREWAPGYSYDDPNWIWHGVIRYTSTAGAHIKLPLWHAHQQFVSKTTGFSGAGPFNMGTGTRCYAFYNTAGDQYIAWSEPSGVPANADYAGTETVTVPDVRVDPAALIGADSVDIEYTVRALDGSNDPITETYRLRSGMEAVLNYVPQFITPAPDDTVLYCRMPYGGMNTLDDWTITAPSVAASGQLVGDQCLSLVATDTGGYPFTPFGKFVKDFSPDYDMSGLTKLQYRWKWRVDHSGEYSPSVKVTFYSDNLTKSSSVTASLSDPGDESWGTVTGVSIGTGVGAATWTAIERVEFTFNDISGVPFPTGPPPVIDIDDVRVRI